MKKFDVIIVCRMGSSRFPGKTLKKINGVEMLQVLVSRVKIASIVGEIIIATSTNMCDNELANWAQSKGYKCFRGSEDDVLDRLNSAAEYFNVANIIYLLGDNPFIDYKLIEAAVESYNSGGVDFVTTMSKEYSKDFNSNSMFPIGIRVQVFNSELLKKISKKNLSDYNREHATSYFVENKNDYKIHLVEALDKFKDLCSPNYTLAVNTEDQFNAICKISERLSPKGEYLEIVDILSELYKDSKYYNSLKV